MGYFDRQYASMAFIVMMSKYILERLQTKLENRFQKEICKFMNWSKSDFKKKTQTT